MKLPWFAGRSIKKGKKTVRRLLRIEKEYEKHEGVILPPLDMRYCTSEFRDNQFFLESSKQESLRVVESLGLSPESSLLEIGCGPGRLPIGIIAFFGAIKYYQGVDIDKEAIA